MTNSFMTYKLENGSHHNDSNIKLRLYIIFSYKCITDWQADNGLVDSGLQLLQADNMDDTRSDGH